MNDSFADMKAELDENNDDESELLGAGDKCPEDHCGRELHEITHPRNPQLGTKPHPDAPETEVVCIEDGIVASR